MTDDQYEGCGISKLWATGPDDPFAPACKWHDKAYVEGSWLQNHVSRQFVDDHFLTMMLRIAGDDVKLQARAHTFYGITRMLGGYFWEGKTVPQELMQTARNMLSSQSSLETAFV